MKDEDLPFIERCTACGRIARVSIMHRDPSKTRTIYACADHVSDLRGDGVVFRIEDGEAV